MYRDNTEVQKGQGLRQTDEDGGEEGKKDIYVGKICSQKSARLT